MKTHIEKIKKLIEAGEKIRDEEFYCDIGGEVHNDAGCVFAYPNDEMFKDTNFENNCDFFTQAANTRAEVKQLVAEYERMRDALNEIVEDASSHIGCICDRGESAAGDCWPCRMMNIVDVAHEALTEEQSNG